MPVELGSFDVLIGMDWLRRYHTVIICDEKLIQVPYGKETLTFCGNKSSNGRESRLTVISCSKAQEYTAKGCQVFLAQISAKKEEDKSERKQIEDVPIVEFSELFSRTCRKESSLDWGEEKEENAFQLIKQKLGSCPNLALRKVSEDFVVTVMPSHKAEVRWKDPYISGDWLSRKERIEHSLEVVDGNIPRKDGYHVRWDTLLTQAGVGTFAMEDLRIADIARTVRKCDMCKSYGRKSEAPSGLLVQRNTEENNPLDKLARLYLNRIVARHEIPASIICDRDGRFTSNLEIIQKAVGYGFSMNQMVSSRNSTARARGPFKLSRTCYVLA
ncbi:hypothetical protein Tco_0735695 [Tanacetum coccineum]